MSRPTKYQPGTFLEVDDLTGGRKVVMVGRDGVTYWDGLDIDVYTPLVIHPVMKAVELGSLVRFITSKQLAGAARRIVESLRQRMDARERDTLFVMRMLWSLAPKAQGQGDQWLPDEGLVQWAQAQAELQGSLALRIHQSANERYTQHAH